MQRKELEVDDDPRYDDTTGFIDYYNIARYGPNFWYCHSAKRLINGTFTLRGARRVAYLSRPRLFVIADGDRLNIELDEDRRGFVYFSCRCTSLEDHLEVMEEWSEKDPEEVRAIFAAWRRMKKK